MTSDYSVVIPAYNAGLFLGEALQSVLDQSVPPAEIIVVDDGSSDDTGAVAAGFGDRVKLVVTANRGAGPATTTGMAAVTMPIVALLDADDIWHQDKMERQLALLRDPAGALDAVLGKMVSFGDTHLKDSDGESSGWHRSTLVMWTEKFRAVGDVEGMPNGFGEMVDWFGRARELGLRFAVMDAAVAGRRIHPNSLSFKGGAGRDADYLQTAIRALMRKKQMRS